MFTKNIRIIYLYLVSFISLSMFAGGFISTVYNIVVYFTKRQTYYYSSLQDIFTSMAVILVSVVLYAYHWKSIEFEKGREKIEEKREDTKEEKGGKK